MAPPPAGPPDGGWGFVVVTATSSCFFLGVGMSRCAGILYSSWMLEFESSAAVTGALASVVVSGAHFSCPIGAAVCKLLGVRVTMMLGGFLSTLGVLLSSWGQSIYYMYVMYAITGVGLGLSITSGIVVVALYFKKYYKAANGVASAGVGLGLVAFPPLLQLLLDNYGWRGALLVTSAIIGNVCVGGALYRPLPRPRAVARTEGAGSESVNQDVLAMRELNEDADDYSQSPGHEHRRSSRWRRQHCPGCLSRLSSLLGLNLLRNGRFAFFCWVNLLAAMPYIGYTIFVVPRASAVGISDRAVSLVLSALGVASILGRLASGFLTNWRVSAVKLYTGALLCCCGGTLLAQLETYGSFVASGGLVGFFTGVTQATTVVVVRKYVGNENVGPAIGLCYFISGIGYFLGPAITGSIFDMTASYPATFYFVAGVFFLAFAHMMCLAHLHKCPEPRCGVISYQAATDV